MLDEEIEIQRAEDAKRKAMLEEVKVIVDKIIGYMRLADQVKTKVFCDDCCDPELQIGDMGCTVICGTVKQKTIIGEKEVDGFIIGHMVHNPGVRYYSDGSGEPPSYEFVEDDTASCPRTAAYKGVEMLFGVTLNSAAEAYDEE